MTDTSTGSDLTPMFATGGQPAQSSNTAPHPSPIFDTGPHPNPLQPIEEIPDAFVPQAFSELETVDTGEFRRAVTGYIEPVAVAATPVAVPGSQQFVKRWQFALVVVGVWVVGAAAGLGLYYWWYTALDKTLPVFGILLYLTLCMVASLLVSMVPNRPQLTALAIALMAVPLASTAAAAVLHGAYFFEWIARPALG